MNSNTFKNVNQDKKILWDQVCKTDPKYTKKVPISGKKITAIDAYSQIMTATKIFGPYGENWGFKNISIDTQSLKDQKCALFCAEFFYPNGSFPIINSICMFRRINGKEYFDYDFCKKIETDSLTKALSKLGFNADVFLGMFDDNRYIADREKEIKKVENNKITYIIRNIESTKNLKELEKVVALLKNESEHIRKNEFIKNSYKEKVLCFKNNGNE